MGLEGINNEIIAYIILIVNSEEFIDTFLITGEFNMSFSYLVIPLISSNFLSCCLIFEKMSIYIF